MKVGSSTVMFTVRIQLFLDSNRFARKHQKNCLRGSIFVDQNLLEGGSESFFAYLPRIGWGEPLYLRNRAIIAFKRTTSSYVSSSAWQVGKNPSESPSSKFWSTNRAPQTIFLMFSGDAIWIQKLPNCNCKQDSARSHLQPWSKDLKLHLDIVLVYLTQHHEWQLHTTYAFCKIVD